MYCINILSTISQCVETIKSVDRTVREVEDEVMKEAGKEISETAQFFDAERLNFGLVQVVYEWARAKVINNHRGIFICVFTF